MGKCPSHVSSPTAWLSEPAETSSPPLASWHRSTSVMKILGNAIPTFSAIFYALSTSFILTEVFGQHIDNKLRVSIMRASSGCKS